MCKADPAQSNTHPNQITAWKAHLVEASSGLFGSGSSASYLPPAIDVMMLHAKIGELTKSRRDTGSSSATHLVMRSGYRRSAIAAVKDFPTIKGSNQWDSADGISPIAGGDAPN